jgi:hypothetical protein
MYAYVVIFDLQNQLTTHQPFHLTFRPASAPMRNPGSV